MQTYSFRNDYSEGCHALILEAMQQSNLSQQSGYGQDEYSQAAQKAIQRHLNNPASKVYFVSGGTQANTIVIKAMLKPYQTVIAAQTAHIHVHEAAAVEATGHKIETVTTADGKLTPADVLTIVNKFEDYHTAQPAAVYISNATETGTVYNKSELQALRDVCNRHNLYLFADGARLGSALCSAHSDITLHDLSQLTDAFYIGGTKNGALLGEAIVLNNPALQPDFMFYLKQHGALLSKGRLLGIQFLTLFADNLFFDLAHHANLMAQQLAQAISERGYTFLTPPQSNQIFPILPNDVIQQLSEHYEFYVWKKIDAHQSAIRLVTSWATDAARVKEFAERLR